MKSKNRKLILIFVVLLTVNLLFWLTGRIGSTVSFNEDLFVVSDTASVNAIHISAGERGISLVRGPQGWMLNDRYRADEGLRRLLFSIIHRVQVKKPVQTDMHSPIQVTIEGKNPMSFSVWGNLTKTRTFFSPAHNEESYEVGIPGYNEYLAGIFELNSDQWRDRLLLDASWRTIQQLSLDYPGSVAKDFEIRFRDEFFEVTGINAIDSAGVVDYLNQFQFFEINEWISQGRFPRYDSLSKRPPLATLTMETINRRDPFVLYIYPSLAGEPFHMVMDDQENMMAIDKKRIEVILATRDDFRVAN